MTLLAWFANLFEVVFIFQFINQLGVSIIDPDQSHATMIRARQSEMIMLSNIIHAV